jgi:ferredoxin-NADP reductase
VGGGIGVTPMLAMAWRLHRLGRPFELHYCARSREQAAFVDEMAGAPWADRVRLHFDDDGAAPRIEPRRVLAAAPAGRHLYVCGPAGFMDWVMAEAGQAGLAAAQVHREYFSAPIQAVGENSAFELVARRSGKSVSVGADQSLLDALRGIGVKIAVSCEEGVCGTCMCTVLEGEPEHRDAYLTDEERAANDQILVCCSRSRSARLVLDV